MILKGSQRGRGQDLAAHLMRTEDNEHLELHELRGFTSDNLRDAFKEAEAISRATKCRQYLFSLSFNPPAQEKVSVTAFEAAIDQAEARLGLGGQPRAVVFHEKEGRRHAHCVWSRIDADTLTACQMSFFKKKLVGLSRDLFLEHGWDMPQGLVDAAARNPANFTLAEWQQAKRHGLDPRWMKSAVQECWTGSDTSEAFEKRLEANGLFLSRGDRRGFVVLDHNGEVHSLPRALGIKTKEVTARLGKRDDLRSVYETKVVIGEVMAPALRRHVTDSRAQFSKRAEKLEAYRTEMTGFHRNAREKLTARQQIEWDAETKDRAARLPTGMSGLWHRLTGKYQHIRQENELAAVATKGRHGSERQALIDEQLDQRRVLQERIQVMRNEQAEQLRGLRQDIGRYVAFSRSAAEERALGHSAEMGLGLQREL